METKKEKKEPVFNEANFRKLIEVIDVSGRQWLDCDRDMLEDSWHTGLTHTNPDILRGFGFQCEERANLIEAVKMADDFQEEEKKQTNGVIKFKNDLKPIAIDDKEIN